MKKILAVILSVGMLFSLCACGGSTKNIQNSEITKEEYEQMTANDLLKGIKDKKNVTPEEYAAIVETLEFVNIKDNFELEKNITDDALKTIKNDAEHSRGYPPGLSFCGIVKYLR